MAKKVIFTTKLQDFRPVIWYGEPIFSKYKQLQSVLREGIGDKYADFFTEPAVNQESIENNGSAAWMSDYISKGKPFSKLQGQELENAKAQLQQILNKIDIFSKELQAEENASQKEIGELLSLAVEVPGLDYIFIEDNKISIVLWGFTSDKAEKQNFNINKVVAAPITPPPPPPPPVDEKTLKEVKTQEVVVTPPPPPKDEKEKKKGMPPWLWAIIGALIMLLILLLVWFFFLRNPTSVADLPDNGVLPPVDTTNTGYDPDDEAKKKIFTDKVNIVLQTDVNLINFANSINEKYPDDLEVVFYDTLINLMQIKTPENEWKQWADTMKTHKEVRLTFSESVFARATPTDPDFSDATKNWYFEEIGVYKAWETSMGSSDVVVAIIDNGFDLTHPEFKDKIVKPWNVYEQSDKLYPINIEGGEHGTHVAATAIGLADNNSGLCGIAPNCKFMPIQVADENGALSSLSIVSGILYSINQGADVVNISLGTYFDAPVLQLPDATQELFAKSLYPDEALFWEELYQFGEENGVIIIQAAGNQDIVTGIDPFARSLKTITVAATNQSDTKADFSNWGELSTLSAPGTEIYSATPNNTYNFLQGTSMASPIVTGGVALIKSAHPDWSNEKIIEALVNTAIPIQSGHYIAPMIQLDKAIAYGDSTLIIPDEADDLSFAAGLWKSDNDLVSTINKKPIELYFEIKEDGSGELTLVESDGTKCIAELITTFENGELLLVQQEEAKCEGIDKSYREYRFVCVQGEDNQADCTAKEKNGSGEFLDFNLEKVK